MLTFLNYAIFFAGLGLTHTTRDFETTATDQQQTI